MNEDQFLKINEPNVVHDTIDGETIVLNLLTGNYFSLDGTGALLWDCIRETGQWKPAVSILSREDIALEEEIEQSIAAFVESLKEENLLIPTAMNDHPGISPELQDKLLQASGSFKKPVLNKYTDMQELLLLDPIHDVNERGWPESQEPSENEENPTAR
jgi:hypothetical protein